MVRRADAPERILRIDHAPHRRDEAQQLQVRHIDAPAHRRALADNGGVDSIAEIQRYAEWFTALARQGTVVLAAAPPPRPDEWPQGFPLPEGPMLHEATLVAVRPARRCGTVQGDRLAGSLGLRRADARGDRGRSERGYELRHLELKGPGPRSDTHLFAKVARAALGMGNLRDGGQVVIGIADTDPAAMLPGLQQEDLTSWLSYDDVARKLAEYANPPLRFDVLEMSLSSSASVAVLNVYEFGDMPHLCARGYDPVLRKGALYVRPRKVPETSEVASLVEMREVLELATEQALRAYVSTGERAGVTISAGPSDDDRYEQERSRGWPDP
jgi:hypothetical protein